MIILPWWVIAFWDWFWYFRRGKIRYRVYNQGDTWKAMAVTKDMAIWNCYGGTREQALEMAKYRMKKALNEEQNA
ncbi:hypothetical protein J1P26_22450 [Neobacillus sp. MM2021_6]|uniref:hypothetical protein n=1 Tax=Bacillaceae TaxID=186817 RepID=UPI00140B5B03|nr:MULTISPECIES: hypothetical protein [Bacillaceae]MBO0962458.1 hypothetical protein [Neobacillus sp. MM2021_6]